MCDNYIVSCVQESKVLKFLGFMWNPLSWVMEMAAVIAIGLANSDHRPPDWQDFVVVVLLVLNSTISFIEENNPVEEVFVKLKCSNKGLTTSDAQARIAMFGPNKLEEKNVRT